MKFHILDLMWLAAVAGLAAGTFADRRNYERREAELEEKVELYETDISDLRRRLNKYEPPQLTPQPSLASSKPLDPMPPRPCGNPNCAKCNLRFPGRSAWNDSPAGTAGAPTPMGWGARPGQRKPCGT